MSESDTSAIDNKKEETSSTGSSGFVANIGKFLTTLILLILIIVIYFLFGGLILYGCKIGQSNILPTNEKCYPYTDSKLDIETILTNIFITYTDPQLSMKLKFPYDAANSKNTILDMFRNYKNDPHSHFLTNYFISIIESIISFNYSSINFLLNMFNGLPESFIILLGPVVMPIFLFFVFLLDHLYLLYLWFAKMGWFFKQNSNTSNDQKPNWTNVTFLEPVNYGCAVLLVILFLILFWGLLFTLPVLPFLTMAWCVFSSIGFNGEMNDKTVTALTIIKDLFKYYKVTIMSILSFFVVISAFSNLGTIPGIFSMIVLILIFWGIISIDLFKTIDPENLSKLVSNNQAKKVCSFKEATKSKHGFLYNLIFPQKGGEQLVKELKKIGKNR